MNHSIARRPARFAPHCIAAAAALAAAGATAQQAPEVGKLAPVNVTAERRTENVQDVPNSVSTLGSEILEAIGTSGQDVRVLSGRVPSLNIESSFGRAFPRFYVRGYGNTDFRLNASQPVSLVYDDIVQENPILKGFPVFDVDRIEVLRGPQGTLFGRNTPAGVVKFESVRPTKSLEGYGSLSFGTFKTINAEGAVNVPTSGDSALRFSALNQTRDDWVHNTVPGGRTQDFEGYRDTAFRAQWSIEPSKDLSALVNVHARDLDGSARLFRANIIRPGTNDFVSGFDERTISTDGNFSRKHCVRPVIVPLEPMPTTTASTCPSICSRISGPVVVEWALGLSGLPPHTRPIRLPCWEAGRGDGVFGAEAAARHYFRVSAANLNPTQASRLAAMVPRPRYYDKVRDSPALERRAGLIFDRMADSQVP